MDAINYPSLNLPCLLLASGTSSGGFRTCSVSSGNQSNWHHTAWRLENYRYSLFRSYVSVPSSLSLLVLIMFIKLQDLLQWTNKIDIQHVLWRVMKSSTHTLNKHVSEQNMIMPISMYDFVVFWTDDRGFAATTARLNIFYTNCSLRTYYQMETVACQWWLCNYLAFLAIHHRNDADGSVI